MKVNVNVCRQSYLPALHSAWAGLVLTSLQRAELVENTVAVVVKLVWALVWQEQFIDLAGENLTPEVERKYLPFAVS